MKTNTKKGKLLKEKLGKIRKTWSGEKGLSFTCERRKRERTRKRRSKYKKDTAFFYSKFSSSISSPLQSTLFISSPSLRSQITN
jgi:hypothetical protein